MKYFTQARFQACGDLSEEKAFLAAQAEWEQAITDYNGRLAHIWERLPASVRGLLKGVYLHDSRVIDMYESGRNRFTISLQPLSLPGKRVILHYTRLVGKPIDMLDTFPPEFRSAPLRLLYDELDLEPESKAEGVPILRHNLLFSNGHELLVRFRKVRVEYGTPRPPAPLSAPAQSDTLVHPGRDFA
jgi:hypothetical protein